MSISKNFNDACKNVNMYYYDGNFERVWSKLKTATAEWSQQQLNVSMQYMT